MNIITWPIIFKFIVATLLPVIVFKWKTRSEIVLKLKSPFILDLFVSINRLHIKTKKISSIFVTQTEEDMKEEFYSDLDELVQQLVDNLAKAKLYLHSSTNMYLDEFVSTAFKTIHRKNHWKYMNKERNTFSPDQVSEVYKEWAKELPDKLEDLLTNKITTSLRLELNGRWDYIELQSGLIL